jgi:hypothetical protein
MQGEFLSKGKESNVKGRSLALYLVRYFGLLPILFLGAYLLASSLLPILLGAVFAFVLVYDIWSVRKKVYSEPYRSQKHEYWDEVSRKRFGIAFMSVLLTLLVLIPLIVSIHFFLPFALGTGIVVAWLMLRITRRPPTTSNVVQRS